MIDKLKYYKKHIILYTDILDKCLILCVQYLIYCVYFININNIIILFIKHNNSKHVIYSDVVISSSSSDKWNIIGIQCNVIACD